MIGKRNINRLKDMNHQKQQKKASKAAAVAKINERQYVSRLAGNPDKATNKK